MKKKLLSMVIIGMMAVLVCACGATEDEAQTTDEPGKAAATATLAVESGEQTEPTESLEKYESVYGYAIEYDNNLFEVVNDEGTDYIQKKAQNFETETPVYISISLISEATSQTIADGLVLQSGKDDTKIEETIVGKKA